MAESIQEAQSRGGLLGNVEADRAGKFDSDSLVAVEYEKFTGRYVSFDEAQGLFKVKP
jgi:hypothetical protein